MGAPPPPDATPLPADPAAVAVVAGVTTGAVARWVGTGVEDRAACRGVAAARGAGDAVVVGTALGALLGAAVDGVATGDAWAAPAAAGWATTSATATDTAPPATAMPALTGATRARPRRLGWASDRSA